MISKIINKQQEQQQANKSEATINLILITIDGN